MRVVTAMLICFAISGAHAGAQSASSARKPDADRLGLTCAQILKMNSTEWAESFRQKAGQEQASAPGVVVRANAAYGKCYDQRTDALGASLAKRGRGPSRAEKADFADFEKALKEFEAKALADSQRAGDAEARSYAELYEKQFRYQFYQLFEPKSTGVPEAEKKALNAQASKAQEASQSSPAIASRRSAANDTDEMTKAKNRFGELIGNLPDDKLHELHAAFGAVVSLHALDNAARLAVYRYAIFLLEPRAAEQSYPPPF